MHSIHNEDCLLGCDTMKSDISLLTFQRNVFCCHLQNWRVSQVSNHQDANMKLSSHSFVRYVHNAHSFCITSFSSEFNAPYISVAVSSCLYVDELRYSVAIKCSWQLCNMTNALWNKMSETAWVLSLNTVSWYSLIRCIKRLSSKFCLWIISWHCPYLDYTMPHAWMSDKWWTGMNLEKSSQHLTEASQHLPGMTE